MPGGRGGGGGGGGGPNKRRAGGQQHQQHQRRRHHRPGPPAVDPSEFERQLEEQRRRQQQRQQQQQEQQQAEGAPPSAAPSQVPFLLRGFEYDPTRQRFFPRQQRGRGRGGVLRAAASASASAASAAASAQRQPPQPAMAFGRGGIWARLRDRERTGVGRVGALMRSMVRSCLKDEADKWPGGLGSDRPVNDMDFKGGRLALVRGHGIQIDLLGAEGRPCDHRRSEILWTSSPVTQVRWRPVGPASDTFAVIEAGGALDGAVVVHKALDESWGWRERRQDSYALHHGDAWAVEWEPTRGERLLVGVSSGTPLMLLDLQAQQWVAPHLGSSLHSDCFAPAWLSPDSALLGLRNGEVRLADFRAPLRGAPTTTLPLVNRMGNVVDQICALRDGRGIVVSDRLGALRLGDLRVPGRTVRDLVVADARGTGVVASTGFALEPWTESLCATLTWDGTVKFLSLRGPLDEDPLLREWSLIDDGDEDEEVRFFLARRWEGEDFAAGVRDPMEQMGVGYFRGPWPPLWCGDRRSNNTVFGLQFPRTYTGDLMESDDEDDW